MIVTIATSVTEIEIGIETEIETIEIVTTGTTGMIKTGKIETDRIGVIAIRETGANESRTDDSRPKMNGATLLLAREPSGCWAC